MANILLIEVTFSVFKLFKFIIFKEVHLLNIYCISVTSELSKSDKSISIISLNSENIYLQVFNLDSHSNLISSSISSIVIELIFLPINIPFTYIASGFGIYLLFIISTLSFLFTFIFII